ncbi:MAG: energy-coupling factor transporter transmembrane protein EcfT [Clostridiales bacterium]|jgi:energy-coupling factor transport system permease protein|nr:energy-coupling factor transporter transmembrane protein EcfT [Clostridiales bacterium]
MTAELLRGDAYQGLRLDPRTKMAMVFVVGIILTAGGYGGLMTYVRPALAFMPLLLLLLSKRWSAAAFYAAAFSAAYLGEIFLLSSTFGILNFILLASVGLFARFMPGLMMGYFLVSTTTVSDFMSAMRKMHVTEKLAIPLSVMFRFFPTVREEYGAIGDAMRMRGVSLCGGKPLKMLEYRFVPMMMCSLKIGEELSTAALTRGLGSPAKRTNICRIGFHAQDIPFLMLSAFCLAAYVRWLIANGGGAW